MKNPKKQGRNALAGGSPESIPTPRPRVYVIMPSAITPIPSQKSFIFAHGFTSLECYHFPHLIVVVKKLSTYYPGCYNRLTSAPLQ
jgi:hypothetical protein